MKNEKKGFTLAELLVVVAIIAVLVAIAIPVLTTQLEKANESVDISNMRNAYALMSVDVLTEESIDGTKATTFTESNPVYYDGSTLTTKKPSAYGKGKVKDGGTTYSACEDHSYDSTLDYTNSVVICWYDAFNNKVHVTWDTSSSSSGGNTDGGSTSSNTTTIGGLTFDIRDVDDFSTLTGTNHTITLKAGEIIRYKGTIYYVTNDETYNQYYYEEPTGTSNWLYITPTSKVFTSQDVTNNTIENLKVGDLYKDGNNLYIRKSESTHGAPPSTQPSEWYKMN